MSIEINSTKICPCAGCGGVNTIQKDDELHCIDCDGELPDEPMNTSDNTDTDMPEKLDACLICKHNDKTFNDDPCRTCGSGTIDGKKMSFNFELNTNLPPIKEAIKQAKQSTARNAITYFGAYLVDNHEHRFEGGENEIALLCGKVLKAIKACAEGEWNE